jgi:hypothetical protein
MGGPGFGGAKWNAFSRRENEDRQTTKIETREEQNHQKPKAANNAQLLRIEPLCFHPIIYPDEEALAAPSPHHGRLERENFTPRHASPGAPWLPPAGAMNQPTEATPAPPRHRGPRHLLRARRCSYPAQIPAQKKKMRGAVRTKREGGRAMLLPRRCHKRSTMPDAEAARRHEGRVSGEAEGRESSRTNVVGGAAGVGLLGACARGVRRWDGGGVGQEGNAVARKRPAGFWVFSGAFSWGACLGSSNEFVFVCLCFISFLSGEDHGHGVVVRYVIYGQLLVFRFHCWMDSMPLCSSKFQNMLTWKNL